MNRQEVLEFINNVIEEEHGMAVTEDSLLTDCSIDSFWYAIHHSDGRNILGHMVDRVVVSVV